jgi:hypothetical protein
VSRRAPAMPLAATSKRQFGVLFEMPIGDDPRRKSRAQLLALAKLLGRIRQAD